MYEPKEDTGFGTWKSAFDAFKNTRVLAMLFLGFSAGIPILLIFSTMSIWLREAGVSRATIGFFSWAALGYAFKFVWAPIIDKIPIPFLSRLLGRRRSWLLISQLAIIFSLILIGTNDPGTFLNRTAVFAIFLGFSSATQDIVIDAYRIEAVAKRLQGMMSSAYIAGYRLGMLVAGAGALELVSLLEDGSGYNFLAWSHTYFILSCVMLVGVLTTLCIKEPIIKCDSVRLEHSTTDHVKFIACFLLAISAFMSVLFLAPYLLDKINLFLMSNSYVNKSLISFFAETLRLISAIIVAGFVCYILLFFNFAPKKMISEAYWGPVKDFFRRYGKCSLLILALIATYRVSDIVMGVIANVFYVDIGFDKQVIARVTKGFGLIMTILGGFLGGLIIIRFSVTKALFWGAFLAAFTNIFFVFLAKLGNNTSMLAVVIAADNLSAGIASAAFVAYLSGLTNTAFTASQYAIFSSIMLLIPKLLAGYSGLLVESIGYVNFFFLTAILGLPVLILVVLIAKYSAVNRIA